MTALTSCAHPFSRFVMRTRRAATSDVSSHRPSVMAATRLAEGPPASGRRRLLVVCGGSRLRWRNAGRRAPRWAAPYHWGGLWFGFGSERRGVRSPRVFASLRVLAYSVTACFHCSRLAIRTVECALQCLLVLPVPARQLFQKAQRRVETQRAVPLHARPQRRHPVCVRQLLVPDPSRLCREAHIRTSVVRSVCWWRSSFSGSAFVTCTRLAPAARTVIRPSSTPAGQSTVDSTRDCRVRPRVRRAGSDAVGQ